MTPRPQQTRLITLDKIVRDPGLQVRVSLSTERIEDYAACLKPDGGELPAIDLFVAPTADGARYWIGDGWHRLAAHEAAGRQVILAHVREGGRDAALLWAVGANAQHGLPRTSEDKRRAVKLLLLSPGWAEKTDREVMRQCALTNPYLVGEVRAEMEAVGEIRQQKERKGADGKTYQAKKSQKPPSREPWPTSDEPYALWTWIDKRVLALQASGRENPILCAAAELVHEGQRRLRCLSCGADLELRTFQGDRECKACRKANEKRLLEKGRLSRLLPGEALDPEDLKKPLPPVANLSLSAPNPAPPETKETASSSVSPAASPAARDPLPPAEAFYPCAVCGKDFDSFSALSLHRDHDHKPCDLCGRLVGARGADQDSHLRAYHPQAAADRDAMRDALGLSIEEGEQLAQDVVDQMLAAEEAEDTEKPPLPEGDADPLPDLKDAPGKSLRPPLTVEESLDHYRRREALPLDASTRPPSAAEALAAELRAVVAEGGEPQVIFVAINEATDLFALQTLELWRYAQEDAVLYLLHPPTLAHWGQQLRQSWAFTYVHLLAATRGGRHIRLAHPEGLLLVAKRGEMPRGRRGGVEVDAALLEVDLPDLQPDSDCCLSSLAGWFRDATLSPLLALLPPGLSHPAWRVLATPTKEA